MGDHPLEPIILDTARGEIRDQYLSSEKAKERLGWRASFSLDEGLAETITWYRSFLAGRHT
jgi:CDP-glucose 4,6-dehydratase